MVSRCLLPAALLRGCYPHHWGNRERSNVLAHSKVLAQPPFRGSLIRPTNDIRVLMSITDTRLSLTYTYISHILIRILIIRALTQVVSSSILNYDATLLKGLLLYWERLKVFCRILRLHWEQSLNFFGLEQYTLKFPSVVKNTKTKS